MKRIIMHWSAGPNSVTAADREHYHGGVDGWGDRFLGVHKPEANLNPKTGQYAAHTRALNTGSIGLTMCAMRGAVERPFAAGSDPITARQLQAFVAMVAEYAITYRIPVTRRTILSHAEVQPTLGVWQRGKWDIAWLPGMTAPADPVAIGDRLRGMVQAEIDKTHAAAVSLPFLKPRLKLRFPAAGGQR
ncbi:MAG: N-acetylmuramoyl-L-alanine amidase [Paracoccaceae bacterium]